MDTQEIFNTLKNEPEKLTEVSSNPLNDQPSITLDELLSGTETGTSDIPEPEQATTGSNSGPFNSGQSISAGDLISGKTATELLDIAAPSLIAKAARLFGKRIDKFALKASPEEKKIIAPVMQNWLNSITVNTKDPLQALLLVCGFVYGTKLIDLDNSAPVKRQYVKETESGQVRTETRGRKPGTKAGVDFKPKK